MTGAWSPVSPCGDTVPGETAPAHRAAWATTPCARASACSIVSTVQSRIFRRFFGRRRGTTLPANESRCCNSSCRMTAGTRVESCSATPARYPAMGREEHPDASSCAKRKSGGRGSDGPALLCPAAAVCQRWNFKFDDIQTIEQVLPAEAALAGSRAQVCCWWPHDSDPGSVRSVGTSRSDSPVCQNAAVTSPGHRPRGCRARRGQCAAIGSFEAPCAGACTRESTCLGAKKLGLDELVRQRSQVPLRYGFPARTSWLARYPPVPPYRPIRPGE